MPNSLSAAGRSYIESKEGCVLHPYPDGSNKPTKGWGHLIAPGDPWYGPTREIVARGLTGTALRAALAAVGTMTQLEADALLTVDLRPRIACVNSVIHEPLMQPSFDACVSLCFNVGMSGFAGSTVVHLCNSGDLKGAALAFLMWDKEEDPVTGQLVVSANLWRRRVEEMLMFYGSDPRITPTVHPSA